MPEINPQNIEGVNTSHEVLYRQGMESYEPRHPRFMRKVMGTGAATVLHFSGGVPGLKEWKGKREVNPLSRFKVAVADRELELTVGIPQKAFEDDQLSMFADDIAGMGTRVAEVPDDLLAELLINGFATTSVYGAAYDGVAFFSASHPRMSGGTQSNLITPALDAAGFEEARQKLTELTDEHGEPLHKGVLKLRLVVPPALRATAEAILEAKTLASGATNTLYKAAELEVNNQIGAAFGGSDSKWYLMAEKPAMKPFVLYERLAAEFEGPDENSEHKFWEGELVWGVRMRIEGAYGLWQCIVGSNATT